jgi:hypothetical protein
MVAAGENGPLELYMRTCALRQSIEWMGNNPPSKQV